MDTSGQSASVTVYDGVEFHSAISHERQGHSQQLLPLVDAMLDSAGLKKSQLRSLAVVHGPGSFTGLRVAVGIAQGISLGLNLPVFGVNSLLGAAWQCKSKQNKLAVDLDQDNKDAVGFTVLVANDARLGECYYAVYRWSRLYQAFEQLQQPKLGTPQAVLAVASELKTNVSALNHRSATPIALFGSAWKAYDQLAKGAADLNLLSFESDLATVALSKALIECIEKTLSLERGPEALARPQFFSQAEQIQPIYLRDKVALNHQEQQTLRLARALDLDSGLVPVAASDVAELCKLEREVQFSPWTEGMFLDALSHGYIARLIRDKDMNQIQGYWVAMRVMDEWQLLTLGVARPWQGRGLGRWLMNKLAQASKQEDKQAESILLEVRRTNNAALGLYQSLGFITIGERKAYYRDEQGRVDDALVMRLVLGNSP